MQDKTILVVDGTSLSTPFFIAMLRETAGVVEFDDSSKALAAVKRGMNLDVAVLHYRVSVTSLIQAIRRLQPNAGIVAYGSPRMDTPLGVDEYLQEPVLSAELEGTVARYLSKRRKGRLARWAEGSVQAAAERRNANLARHKAVLSN